MQRSKWTISNSYNSNHIEMTLITSQYIFSECFHMHANIHAHHMSLPNAHEHRSTWTQTQVYASLMCVQTCAFIILHMNTPILHTSSMSTQTYKHTKHIFYMHTNVHMHVHTNMSLHHVDLPVHADVYVYHLPCI